ncbi:hypothetical protein LLG96_09275 [bacterium]|nr:hypothetical protein [bacterium]
MSPRSPLPGTPSASRQVRRILLCYSIFLFFSLTFTEIAGALERPVWLKRKFPVLVVEDKLWIGTPSGLYQYHADEDTWTVYGIHSGMPSGDVSILMWDGDYLWAATEKGLAYGDIKLNRWMAFTAENGLPGGNILSIARQGDYVWIGTDHGAARFDRLIEEWERFDMERGLPDSTVYDIAVDGDIVYLATGKGIAEYDTRFEQWRYFGIREGLAADAVRFIHQTAEFLWLFTDGGLSRFNKSLRSIQSYTDNPALCYDMIRDFAVDGDRLWLATSDGVLIYDPANDLWRPYLEESNLPSRSVRAFAFSGDQRWFVTDSGVAVFDETRKTWRHVDRSHGLSADSYEAAAVYGDRTFLVNDKSIDYFRPLDNRWYVYPLAGAAVTKERRTPYLSLDRERGSFVQLGDNLRLGMGGSRFTYRRLRIYDRDLDAGITDVTGESAHRGDLKGQVSLPGDRTINGFYNDTDFSRTLYGVRYRGNRDDAVQELNWGDVRYEQGLSKLVPSIDVFGVSTRVETGAKTERFKRSLISARGVSGEKTTGFETDFFTGNYTASGITIRDVDYIHNRYFRVGGGTDGIIDEGSVTVYVDDNDPGTNTPNTLAGLSLGGVIGDFDRYRPLLDYRLDCARGVIEFLAPLSGGATAIVTGTSQGIPFERLLTGPGNTVRILENRYFTGGMSIIPESFTVELFDAVGSHISLAGYGLDGNGDGRVDPEFIDYTTGILAFPAPRPFPSAVYDPVEPVSSYTLVFRFESEITTFSLSRTNLVRGSETCTVDGEVLTPGEDYVLDYTSGTLLIIKEGIVAEDSEIEVRYGYYRDSTEKFNYAAAGFGPSDNLRMDVAYFSFDGERHRGYMDNYSGLDWFGEYRWRAGGLDFKLTPEAARTTGGSREGNAFNMRGDVSSQRLRFYAEEESYDEGYTPLYEPEFQLGRLGDRTAFGATVYPMDHVDVSAQWSRKRTTSGRGVEDNMGGKVLVSVPSYPVISLSARRRELDDVLLDSRKNTVKGDIEYELPGDLVRRLSLRSVRLYGVWRRSRDEQADNPEITAENGSARTYDNRYARVDVSPMNLVQISTYYRGRMSWADGGEPVNRKEKVYLDATVDRLQGLNLNMRSQGEIEERYPLPGSSPRDVTLYRSLQSSLRVFPGRWAAMMSPFSFEFNYQPSWRGRLQNSETHFGSLDRFWRTADGEDLVSDERFRLHQIRGEWRPVASLFFYAGLDTYDIISRELDSALKTEITRINQKMEYRPTMFSLVTLQYVRDNERKAGVSSTVRDNGLVWVDNRWSERFQTKVNLSYQREERLTGAIIDRIRTFTPLLGFTYRHRKKSSGSTNIELRDDISLTVLRDDSYMFANHSNGYGNTFAIDCYPASVFVFRLRVVTEYKNRLIGGGDALSMRFDARMTAQF